MYKLIFLISKTIESVIKQIDTSGILIVRYNVKLLNRSEPNKPVGFNMRMIIVNLIRDYPLYINS